MNGTLDYAPAGDPTDRADAIFAIGTGPKLTTGSGDEGNTFGNGIYIGNGKAMSALHLMSFEVGANYWSSGYHVLPSDLTDPRSRVARFRRKTDGTDPAGGVVVDYQQIRITGYTAPSPLVDIVILDLASDPVGIDPIAVTDDYTIADTDAVTIAGWGLDGETLGAGSLPNDVRLIDTTAIDASVTGSTMLMLTGDGANYYDSGGAVLVEVTGVWRLVGVLVAVNSSTADATAVRLKYFKNDPNFQIPGLYTPGTPPEGYDVPSAWISPTFDTDILTSLATTDGSADIAIFLTYRIGKGADTGKGILAFDVSDVDPLTAALEMHIFVATPTAALTVRIRRLRRVVTNLANWDTYDGSNAWGTVGADNTSSDVYTDNEFTQALSGAEAADELVEFNSSSLLDMITAAKADDGILRLLVDVVTGTEGDASFHSFDSATAAYRPRLNVTTAAAGGGGGATVYVRRRKGERKRVTFRRGGL